MSRPLKPATDRDEHRARLAVAQLRDARDNLVAAGAVKAAVKVRLAITSAGVPQSPWPISGAGWTDFFAGKDRSECPFPPARLDLQEDYREGWDAAKSFPEVT